MEDVETFYKSYAKESGFDVKRHSNKKKDGVIVRKEYACSKEGTSKVTRKKRKRNQTRQNCKAKIVVLKRAPIGKYVVTIFVEGHNHPLTTPRRKHLTKIHRDVSSVHKSLSKQLTAVNVPPCKQFDFLGVNSGGLENIGCLQQDIYNHRRDCRKEVKGHDGDMLHEYFLHEKEKDPSFSFKIEADNENMITHIFWADAISRRSYKFYGDVVIFDTTYNTNAYSLIFAPLVGVNNHGQTIILACAFLSNETTGSFTWFFKEFLKAMPGDAPRMIITDQDPAMTKAISEVLPQTFHRYCSWHILNKFSEKIDPGKYSHYYDQFQDCIWNSENRDEFDARWTTIVENSGLSDNGWLKIMYDIQSTWVPAYVNHMFSAGMSSSQRAESGHVFYKRFISKENTLIDFMIQFSRAVTRQRHMELIEDHVDINEKPNFDSQFEMADQMARVYTHECFKEFYAQLSQCCNYRFELSHENDTYMVYTALRKKMENPKGRVITYAKDSDFVSCSCKKFEMAGIPCRHILAFLIFI
uniref:protein FAR1-RELATED SEQUENCE 5-like n=1 Tax=Fragaria vesca subsp. vesca TaxID=101020 RepID=UPI0005C8BFEF|nr:PREDICTED: protein FAR1-RELATED SEQUENCE 5-like [Fragaria vesca subsp. vesca]